MTERSERAQREAGKRKRRQILDGAVKVFGAKGPGAFTHRAVARAANVPLGSVTYYFQSGEDLLQQTMLHAIEVEKERLSLVAARLPPSATVDDAVEILTSMFMDRVIENPRHELALFEMFIEAARTPSVRKQTTQWTEMIAGYVDAILPETRAGLRREHAVQIIACAIDGLMLEELSNHSLGLETMRANLHVVVSAVSKSPTA